MRLIPLLLAAGALATIAGCNRSKVEKSSAPAPAPAATGLPPIQGTVLEVLPAPPYSYLRVKAAQGEVWAAVPAAEIKVGAPVTVTVQVKMDKFQSPSLNRTFDAVYMGTLAGAAAPAPHAAAPATPAAPDEKIEKAAGGDARTVAELYAQRKQLENRQAVVRGKVVKYNEGIMGKNWIHLRDGSGSPQVRDNDLIVTTSGTAKLGDVLTVKGPVHVDKDMGLGFKYPVLIEDGKIVK